VALDDEVQRAAAAAAGLAAAGEAVEAVLPTEPTPGERIYLVAFAAAADAERTWVAVDDDGEPLTRRERVREAVSIAAICEVAEEVVPEELLGPSPRLASPQYLDSLGATQAAGLAGALQGAAGAVEELANDVEDHYKLELR
jgi:hypothetical protein